MSQSCLFTTDNKCHLMLSDCTMEDSTSEDLSLIAGAIVTNAMHIPRSLFCPFCAGEYMFEFTLKDHLKRKHAKELAEKAVNFQQLESLQIEQNFLCPYCQAVFYFSGLLPKHIAHFHGYNMLQHWFESSKRAVLAGQNDEPSILYAACSPGLTKIFEDLTIRFTGQHTSGESPKIKSILKKPSHKETSIIHSPSAGLIRRSKSEVLKRTLSVRRELKFDLPPLPTSSEDTSPQKIKRTFSIKKLLAKRKFFSSNKAKTKTTNNFVTSTPINFLDDDSSPARNASPKSAIRLITRPLLFFSERYECAFCTLRYCSNVDLLTHLKDEHKGARFRIFPRYRCGQCGKIFFRNACLVRHCKTKHTPQKN